MGGLSHRDILIKSSWLHISLEEGTEKNDWDYTNDYTLNVVTTEIQEDEGQEAFLLFNCCSES